MLVNASLILNLAVDSISTQSGAPPGDVYFLWPPFAFYRALSLLNAASSNSELTPYTISMLKPGDELFSATMFLLFEIFVLFGLAYYLNAIIPSEFGTTQPWYFPFTALRKWKKQRQPNSMTSKDELNEAVNIEVSEEIKKLEDEDVAAERNRVISEERPSDWPLMMKRIRKVYGVYGFFIVQSSHLEKTQFPDD